MYYVDIFFIGVIKDELERQVGMLLFNSILATCCALYLSIESIVLKQNHYSRITTLFFDDFCLSFRVKRFSFSCYSSVHLILDIWTVVLFASNGTFLCSTVNKICFNEWNWWYDLYCLLHDQYSFSWNYINACFMHI